MEVLTNDDKKELLACNAKVLEFLMDEHPHRLRQIADHFQISESGAGSRIRDLRVAGYTIIRERLKVAGEESKKRIFLYTYKPANYEQLTLPLREEVK